MYRWPAVLICSAAMLGLASVMAVAQQKTVKQCNEEWTANKAGIQASGKTKKAFVAECRGQTTGTATAPKPAVTGAPKTSRTAARSATANVKTAKQCTEEWSANKAAIQASGKTKTVFIAECRGQPAVAATATPKPATTTAPKPPGSAARSAAASVKTAKQCNQEWTANKAAIQASKKTKKAFIAECRTQPAGASTAAAAPSTATPSPEAAPRPSAGASPAGVQPSTAAPARTPPATTSGGQAAAPTAGDQFSTEAAAKARCPGDTVVWVNLDSKIYHFAGTRNYGKTKSGAYMCEKDAMAAGSRAAKNEKRS
jgi:hypothetical protein